MGVLEYGLLIVGFLAIVYWVLSKKDNRTYLEF